MQRPWWRARPRCANSVKPVTGRQLFIFGRQPIHRRMTFAQLRFAFQPPQTVNHDAMREGDKRSKLRKRPRRIEYAQFNRAQAWLWPDIPIEIFSRPVDACAAHDVVKLAKAVPIATVVRNSGMRG